MTKMARLIPIKGIKALRPAQNRKVKAVMASAIGLLLAGAWAAGILREARALPAKALPPMGYDNVALHSVMIGEALLHGQSRSYDQDELPLDTAAAAKLIARHPLRYAAAVARRWRVVAGYHPYLLAAALLGFILGRRKRAVRSLGLLAAYFWGIHCLMSIQSCYFAPLWPILSLIAGVGLASIFDEKPPRMGAVTTPMALTRRGAIALCLAFLGISLAATGYCETMLWTAPHWPQPRRDWWRLFEQGRDEAAAGRFRDAALHLEESARLNPHCEPCAAYAAWAESRNGSPAALDHLARPVDLDLRIFLDVMRAYSLAARHEDTAGRRAMKKALADYDAKHLIRYSDPQSAGAVRAKLNSISRFASVCLGIIQGAPAGPMNRLLRELAAQEGLPHFKMHGIVPARLCPYYQS